jgi:hypothetical protein
VRHEWCPTASKFLSLFREHTFNYTKEIVSTRLFEMFSKLFGVCNNHIHSDVELGQQRPERTFINGFPSAAEFIASDPDHSLAIFHGFHRLSSRNLLYLEAELLELQKQQDDLDIRDSLSQNPDTLQCFRSWKKLDKSTDPAQVERKELITKIRTKSKDYRT